MSLNLAPAARPALPSNTNGPASFLGVIGPSCTRSGVKPSWLLGNNGDKPENSLALVMLI
jgi:hypothetical protein